jgi:hypothetical protein
MKKLVLLGVFALFTILPATAAFAVPMCDGPRFDEDHRKNFGAPVLNEQEAAANAELRLRQQGVDARLSRFWNGCIQTFVNEGGHDVMKFYDYYSLQEIPVN